LQMFGPLVRQPYTRAKPHKLGMPHSKDRLVVRSGETPRRGRDPEFDALSPVGVGEGRKERPGSVTRLTVDQAWRAISGDAAVVGVHVDFESAARAKIDHRLGSPVPRVVDGRPNGGTRRGSLSRGGDRKRESEDGQSSRHHPCNLPELAMAPTSAIHPHQTFAGSACRLSAPERPAAPADNERPPDPAGRDRGPLCDHRTRERVWGSPQPNAHGQAGVPIRMDPRSGADGSGVLGATSAARSQKAAFT
jgi:hypothetical protein